MRHARVAVCCPRGTTPLTPRFLLFHGTDDRFVSPSQTLILHNALRVAGVDSTRYVLQGAGHGDVVFLGHHESGLPWSSRQVMGYLIAFLRKHLRNTAD